MRWGRSRDSFQRLADPGTAEGADAAIELPSGNPAWLVSDGRVLASVEVAQGRVHRARGLIGRTGCEGAVLLCGVRSVHSVGMRFDLDVGFIDRQGVVVHTTRLPRNRVTAPVWRSYCVIEAEAGAFGQWGLKIGDKIEFRC